ncbi:MAG: histidine kinase [Chloroflexota bacterium]|nr:histidine kinase [Chloroflexota bacterium]
MNEDERKRQAHDQHEAVLQALYGIGLGAQTAKAMLERDPAAARAALDYLIELTNSALSDMRTLTTQYRPAPVADGRPLERPH